MPSTDDRKAALILLALAAAGLVLRFAMGEGAPPGAVAYRAAGGSRPLRDSVAARAARLARPLTRDETIDIDRSGAEELMRLPRIGPIIAARIVAEREEHGPFGSLAEFQRRVSGVGPKVVAAVRPYAAFAGRRAGTPVRRGRRVSLNTASAVELAQLPGIGPKRARAIVEDRQQHGPYRRLDDLTRVRGIGPRLVERLRASLRVP